MCVNVYGCSHLGLLYGTGELPNPDKAAVRNKNAHVCVCVCVCTLAFSMTLANSPVQMKQWCGVMSRKQSPLFRDEARGSTRRVCT